MGEWIAGAATSAGGIDRIRDLAAALPAFQETYDFTMGPDQLVQLSGGDTAATIAAAAQQTSGVNAAMVYGTDGGIAPAGLVVMEDDKGVQPVYQARSGSSAPRFLRRIRRSPDILAPIFCVAGP